MSIFGKIKHAAEHGFHDVEEGLRAAGRAIESVPNHVANDLRNEVNRLNGVVAALKHDLSRAQGMANNFSHELLSVEDQIKTLGDELKDKADSLLNDVESFFNKLKNLLEQLKDESNLLKELVPIVTRFTKTIMEAVGHLLEIVAKDLSNFINPDRIMAIWALCKSIVAELASLGQLAIDSAKELEQLIEAAWQWLGNLLERSEQSSKAQFQQLITEIHGDVESLIGKEGFPATLPGISFSLDAVDAFLKQIPDQIWKHASAALHLDYLKEIALKVKDVVVAVAENRPLHIAMRLLFTTVEGFKALIAQTRQMFSLDIDLHIIDYIKAKVGAGEDSGTVAGDADADAGTGLSLGMEVYSISGALLGVLGALLAIVSGTVTFFIDIKGA